MPVVSELVSASFGDANMLAGLASDDSSANTQTADTAGSGSDDSSTLVDFNTYADFVVGAKNTPGDVVGVVAETG